VAEWAVPSYSNRQVNEAGRILAALPQLIEDDVEHAAERVGDALDIIGNWRSCHAYPLQCLKMVLKARAKKIDPSATIAQRLKRLSSIEAKLKRFNQMALSQMQDIGGCRVIVRNTLMVRRLVSMYESDYERDPDKGAEFVKKYDYICCPKPDGYRGVHLVYKYRSRSEARKTFNGLRIEIQIRSRSQHAWATATETVSAFTGQALKSSVGEEPWKRFFALMSSVIALREKSPLVPNTPTDKVALVEELGVLEKTLKVRILLGSWAASVQHLSTKNGTDAFAFLLVLDTRRYTVHATGYKKRDLRKASEDYLAMEKEIEMEPGRQAVLVSVESMKALRVAYPNFYIDTDAFLREVDRAIGAKRDETRS